MSTYWVTFRISKKTFNHKDHDDRYKALQEAVRTCTTKWWVDPTNLYVFELDRDIDSLAESFKHAIDPTHDLFLIREMNAEFGCHLRQNRRSRYLCSDALSQTAVIVRVTRAGIA